MFARRKSSSDTTRTRVGRGLASHRGGPTTSHRGPRVDPSMRRVHALDGLIALVPVGVAALLIAFCLTGAQLYSSSAGSAALDTQLDETCRSASALTLADPVRALPAPSNASPRSGAAVPFVEPAAAVGRSPAVPPAESALPRRFTVLGSRASTTTSRPCCNRWRPARSPCRPGSWRDGSTIGDMVAVDGADLRSRSTSSDPPIDPVPSFWCAYPDLLVPTAQRRPPTAVGDRFARDVAALGASTYDEYRVVDEPLTLTDAAALRTGYAEATAEWTSSFPQRRGRPRAQRTRAGRRTARTSVRTTSIAIWRR